LLASVEASKHTIADKGYDADHLRSFLDGRSTTAVMSGRRPLVKGCLGAVVNVSGAVMSTAC
jgi:hypothetical protein